MMETRRIHTLIKVDLSFELGSVQVDEQFPYVYRITNKETGQVNEAVMFRFVDDHESDYVRNILFVLIPDDDGLASFYQRESLKNNYDIDISSLNITNADDIIYRHKDKIKIETLMNMPIGNHNNI